MDGRDGRGSTPVYLAFFQVANLRFDPLLPNWG
jgi:hypothetical protein